jgi:hypothetical protein
MLKNYNKNLGKTIRQAVGGALIVLSGIMAAASSAALKIEEVEPMNQKTPVEAGVWGGAGINLAVEAESAGIEFDCAAAEISEKLYLDRKGNFKAAGVYIRQTPGPIRVDLPPKRQPAEFRGKVTDKKMTLEIVLTETDESAGRFTLERGQAGRLHKCR